VTLDHFWRVRNVAVVLSGSGVEDVVEFDAPRIAESITARAVG